jgi:hypothetical protein
MSPFSKDVFAIQKLSLLNEEGNVDFRAGGTTEILSDNALLKTSK